MKPRPTSNPRQRFQLLETAYDERQAPPSRVELIDDDSRTILAHNDSPDVGYSWSVNPYRGCVHACAYCYARPTHEYLGFGAGTDFDTKILVKRRAPELLRAAFEKPSWKGELVAFSGVTDCYQPIEAKLELTRACLKVCAEYRQPVSVVTKAPLIERDLDLLVELSRSAHVHVFVTVPFIDATCARALEPFVANPERRLETVARLVSAGIPVGVNVAPIIPGLNDEQVAKVLEAARGAGATSAGYVLLRLPGAVREVFEERLRRAFPDRAERVLHRVRETRGGALYDSRWGVRKRGTGLYAEQIHALFETAARRLGLNAGFGSAGAATTFRRPSKLGRQMTLL